MKLETICVQGGYEPKSGDPRVLPLYQSTTYYYKTPEAEQVQSVVKQEVL